MASASPPVPGNASSRCKVNGCQHCQNQKIPVVSCENGESPNDDDDDDGDGDEDDDDDDNDDDDVTGPG